jgi:hypothetical protein
LRSKGNLEIRNFEEKCKRVRVEKKGEWKKYHWMSQVSQTRTYKEELLVERQKAEKKGSIQKIIRVNAKPKEKKKEKKRKIKFVGKVKKKKKKKEMTCYHCQKKEHYVYECLKKITTQGFIVEVSLGDESVEEKYWKLTKDILVIEEVSDESELNQMRRNWDFVLVLWGVRSINNIWATYDSKSNITLANEEIYVKLEREKCTITKKVKSLSSQTMDI